MKTKLTLLPNKNNVKKAKRISSLLTWLFLIPLLGLLIVFLLPQLQKESIVFLLDSSSSMNNEFRQAADGSKIDVAKQAILQVIDELPLNIPITLVTYADGNCAGSGVDWIIQQPENKLGGTIVTTSYEDRSELYLQIMEIQPSGGTHLSEALWKTIMYLRQESLQRQYRIIVVGDGEDHCNAIEIGNTVLNHADDLTFKIDAIGLDLSEEERETLETLALEGRGIYYSVDNTDNLIIALKEITYGMGDDYWPLIISGIVIFCMFILALFTKKFV